MERARAFNPFLVAKSDKLKKLIEEVQQQIRGCEAYYQTRQRARRVADQKTHERMIEAILCDVCLLHLDPQYDAVHLPLSNKVLRKASRYKSPVLGKTLPDLLNIMTAPEMDFVLLTKGQSTSTLQICCAVSSTLKMFCCRFVAPFSNRKTSGNSTLSCIFLDRTM